MSSGKYLLSFILTVFLVGGLSPSVWTTEEEMEEEVEEEDDQDSWADEEEDFGGDDYDGIGNPLETEDLPPIQGFIGHWSRKDKRAVRASINRIPNVRIRNWIAANVKLERSDEANHHPVSASGDKLRFKDSFFDEEFDNQDGLVTFEAGKVFLHVMKDEPADGKTFFSWFTSYLGTYGKVINDMRAAEHKDQRLTIPQYTQYSPSNEPRRSLVKDSDNPSQFGWMFRQRALGLTRPATGAISSQTEWNEAINNPTFPPEPEQAGGHPIVGGVTPAGEQNEVIRLFVGGGS